MKKIYIGTAQFGLNYGISNKTGRTKKEEIKNILETAINNKLSGIDTAEAYGIAQKILGEMKDITSKLEVQTKIFFDEEEKKIANRKERLSQKLNKCLKELNRKSIETLLIHDFADIDEISNDEKEWLEEIKKEGIVKHIGASIYADQVITKESLKIFDMVQLGISAYDQRMIKNGTIDIMQDNNVKIQARSIFCQGLILMKPEEMPSYISDAFKNHHKKQIEWTRTEGITQCEMAIMFAKGIKEIDSVVVGINNKNQLDEILNAWNSSRSIKSSTKKTELGWNKRDIDPRYWSNKK